ncbi:excinuclease ABC subunit UvrA [Thiorhodococcus fuscus]|uniref:UvrABC system protein A n=1 Tax=Thiorhodococcus fuscus TaxID=527200 RepID=A0ABW4YAT3_9GAMM
MQHQQRRDHLNDTTPSSTDATHPTDSSQPNAIRLRGVRQNNLKNLDLDLPLGQLTVVTGVSGSGKSSLAFDTLYAEGQRRYVETFSAYARQFLDRMDRPAADRIEGIPPAIAIDQTNPVRTSRSTVGTMTELNDHLKLLFARGARLFCEGCGHEVRRDSPESVWNALSADPAFAERRVLIVFPVQVPASLGLERIKEMLAQQGYVRLLREEPERIQVIQDRLRLTPENLSRALEAIETALTKGHGRLLVYPQNDLKELETPRRFSSDLHCPDCDIQYRDPAPNLFSFNSPFGACETCRGFGRTIGIDWSLVIPDQSKSLIEGAIKPIQSDSYAEVQEDLMRFARQRGLPTEIAWRDLSDADRDWVIEGEGSWDAGVWYGIRRFFDWLEGRSYKMHVRVLLSRYRSYDVCPTCHGARLRDEALDWRIGSTELTERILPTHERFRHARTNMQESTWNDLPGLAIHDLMRLPIARCRDFFESLRLDGPLDQALDLLLTEIRARLRYLCEVGLGYLTLDRQSRTLSGGEVQRINLTTALGTSLVNSLFVLDEPSIGLHPRDMDRVTQVLLRLRDRGNSLVVVEHDPQIMLAADRIVDIGPGPGEHGGRIVFQGAPAEIFAATDSLTGDYLAGRRQVAPPTPARTPSDTDRWLQVRGARANNLKGIDVAIPLDRLVVVTGVSGSGKSTLVQEVLYKALCQTKAHPEGTPGEHDDIEGDAAIADVLLLDQSSIGRTSRSNPASYVGAFEVLRKRFAAQPAAKERGYTAGTFSFNSGDGRCPTCGGNGYEHLEMQFLADVYLRCPDCDGRRYRDAVLEVQVPSATDPSRACSIAEVLEMTTTEALDFFAGDRDLQRVLEPLQAVGLGYLRLGQPVPTLSGGEAQRLKLAGHLAKSARRKAGDGGLLFLLDEPTTGLHFADIAVLLQAFRHLIDQGHSLLVIEHNLDVIAAADWLIDLGPEGGDEGGRLVCAGTPDDVTAHPTSHTGRALRTMRRQQEPAVAEPRAATYRATEPGVAETQTHAISIRHAREHNLKDLSLSIPRGRLTVITGVSGSGKSTLAFDILFNEGQRRYLESLNAYARQFVQPAARADVDAIFGIPPTVAIEQRTSRGGAKSTVATLTEIHHYLRLLYVKLGVQWCPTCDIPIEPMTREAILDRLLRERAGQRIALMAPMVVARKGLYKELAAWAAGKGWECLRVDGEPVPTADWPRLDRYREHSIDLPLGELEIVPAQESRLRDLLDQALDLGKGQIRAVRVEQGRWRDESHYSTERACPSCGRAFPEPDPRLFSYNSRHGWCPACLGTGQVLAGFDADQSGEEGQWLDSGTADSRPCPACSGARLKPEALAVRFRGRSIAELSALTIDAAADQLGRLELDARESAIAQDLIAEVRDRLAFLSEVGLGYLSLDRGAPTLSGGEAQRIRLAAQLGSNLQGVCYILDEPTIGLHPRDNRLLLDTLARLEGKGNTLVVVEHDEETIRRAEHVIDLGPGAGTRGGTIIAEGTAEQLIANPDSITGRFLGRPHGRSRPHRPVDKTTDWLTIEGAQRNNLQDLEARLPLGRLVCVTGVSGSGKSTLVREVLVGTLTHLLSNQRTAKGRARKAELIGCRGISGWQRLTRVLEVDQTPIGKTPRSCPATYVGFWDAIRRLFAATQEARIRGWGPARFSFNTADGRCPACEGQGVQKLEMSFLPDVRMTCDLCGGSRFDRETREVRYQGLDIGQVLDLEIERAAELFAAHRGIRHPLALLQDVGLGYLTLGQPSPTLSGGEAQRIKLVTELAKARPNPEGTTNRPTLYVLDEPTVGLHMADVARLVEVLHRLVDAGHSVLVIEHNLDLIAEADWVLDMGPEGGDAGGRIVAQGTPEEIAAADALPTAQALRRHLDG